MHELAVIVGEEVTVRDLVPVFDQFLGDLDEVRIGVLKHLADFIKVEVHAFSLRTYRFSSVQY
jgi:serine/threonine-protein phosphatase 4 regulatory subunit 1